MGKLCTKAANLSLKIDGNQNVPEVKPQNHKKSTPVHHENGYFIFLAKMPTK